MSKILIGLVVGLFMFGMAGVANSTIYNISKIPNYRGFDVNGFIEFSDSYYPNRPPSTGDGEALYPWIRSDIISWSWTVTIYEASLLEDGYKNKYHKSGDGGSITFHNDINDPHRPGYDFLTAFTLDLSESNTSFYVNDLDRTWNNAKYDMGITKTDLNYTKTNTFESDVYRDIYSDGKQIGNYGIKLTLSPVPEPATMLLFGLGLLGLAGVSRRKK